MKESLGAARLIMVLGSLSPLFVILTVRGVEGISDKWLLIFSLLMVVVPNLFLWWRIKTAKRLKEKRELTTGKVEDHRDHLLVYLFTMLLPFFMVSPQSHRELAAYILALVFIVFLFWHLNLHYMNLMFALFDYKIFTVHPSEGSAAQNSKYSWVLITKRSYVPEGKRLIVYRLSNTVYMEV